MERSDDNQANDQLDLAADIIKNILTLSEKCRLYGEEDIMEKAGRCLADIDRLEAFINGNQMQL